MEPNLPYRWCATAMMQSFVQKRHELLSFSIGSLTDSSSSSSLAGSRSVSGPRSAPYARGDCRRIKSAPCVRHPRDPIHAIHSFRAYSLDPLLQLSLSLSSSFLFLPY